MNRRRTGVKQATLSVAVVVPVVAPPGLFSSCVAPPGRERPGYEVAPGKPGF